MSIPELLEWFHSKWPFSTSPSSVDDQVFLKEYFRCIAGVNG